MKYMLLVYMQEQTLELSEGCLGLADRVHEAGQWVSGGILQPVATATSVKVREGRRVITDGPFAETREQLAGYLMIDVDNLDDAITIASQHPVAQVGTIEVRPVFYIPEFVVSSEKDQ